MKTKMLLLKQDREAVGFVTERHLVDVCDHDLSAGKLMEHVVSSQLLHFGCCVTATQLCIKLFKGYDLPFWMLFGVDNNNY